MHVQTHQIVYIKYVPIFVYQLKDKGEKIKKGKREKTCFCSEMF